MANWSDNNWVSKDYIGTYYNGCGVHIEKFNALVNNIFYLYKILKDKNLA